MCVCLPRATLLIYRWNYFSTTTTKKWQEKISKSRRRRIRRKWEEFGTWGELKHKWIAESHWCGWRWWVWWFLFEYISSGSQSLYTWWFPSIYPKGSKVPRTQVVPPFGKTTFYERGVSFSTQFNDSKTSRPNFPPPSAQEEEEEGKRWEQANETVFLISLEVKKEKRFLFRKKKIKAKKLLLLPFRMDLNSAEKELQKSVTGWIHYTSRV